MRDCADWVFVLALCTIVLFVIVASLIEASQRSVEKSEAVEQAVDNADDSTSTKEGRPARRNRSRTGAHGSSRP